MRSTSLSLQACENHRHTCTHEPTSTSRLVGKNRLYKCREVTGTGVDRQGHKGALKWGQTEGGAAHAVHRPAGKKRRLNGRFREETDFSALAASKGFPPSAIRLELCKSGIVVGGYQALIRVCEARFRVRKVSFRIHRFKISWRLSSECSKEISMIFWSARSRFHHLGDQLLPDSLSPLRQNSQICTLHTNNLRTNHQTKLRTEGKVARLWERPSVCCPGNERPCPKGPSAT